MTEFSFSLFLFLDEGLGTVKVLISERKVLSGELIISSYFKGFQKELMPILKNIAEC